MGIVHVLTGADHLSAIATLSVNVGNFRAFWYGVRWGIGHSIGLVVVGSVFIALENLHYNNNNQDKDGDGDESSDSRVIVIPEKLENLAACFVGIFMIALGLYNLHGAHRKRREKQRKDTCCGRRRHCHHHQCHHLHDETNDGNDNYDDRKSCDSLTATTVSIINYGDWSNKSAMGIVDDVDEEDNRYPPKPQYSSPDGPESLSSSPSSVDPMGIDKDLCETRTNNNNNNNDNDNDDDDAAGVSTKNFLSLWIGIFHGVAGPGGVLGVVPAVKLHNAWHSAVYLGSFCASSIAVMGMVAALYGSLSAKWTRKDDNLAYRMEAFSASLSLLVGCTWLILLYLGILDDVFP
jgi:hypothetical protein